MNRVIDLFAGGGGMSLGFQQAGFEVVCAMEKWQPAIEVYRTNFSNHPVHDTDLSNEDEAVEVIQRYSPDIIIGGPPCQDFSSAGKRDEQQGRASLTVHFANIIVACQPEYFVMENVSRALGSQAFKKAVAIFKQGGYGLTVKVLDASLCGTPQIRKRLFLIGEKGGKDESLSHLLDAGLASQPMTLRDYFGDRLGFTHYYRHPRSYARRGVFSIDEPSPTIRGVNRPVPKGYPGHAGDAVSASEGIRSLTTLERAQIQTFPHHFHFPGSKTDVEQVIGNAVPVKLAEYVASCLARHIQAGGGSAKRQIPAQGDGPVEGIPSRAQRHRPAAERPPQEGAGIQNSEGGLPRGIPQTNRNCCTSNLRPPSHKYSGASFMQPIRQIIEDAPEIIPIPPELRHQRVEIIFWPLDKLECEQDSTGWPVGFFEATAGCLVDDPIVRAPQGEYEQRLELE